MGDKVGENPAALRAAVFLLSAKNRRGVFKHPPAGRRLTRALLELFFALQFFRNISYTNALAIVKLSVASTNGVHF